MLPDIGISAQMLLDRGHSAQADTTGHWELSADAARQRALSSGSICYNIGSSAQMLLDRGHTAQAGAARHYELSLSKEPHIFRSFTR